jgi:hypothetical protein
VTICPRYGSPCRVRHGNGPVLVSAWEEEGASRVAGLVREWRRLQALGAPVLGATIGFWQALESLSVWWETFHIRHASYAAENRLLSGDS